VKETNPAVMELRKREVHHLDAALKHIEKSLKIGK
jgi:hypothetical protein